MDVLSLKTLVYGDWGWVSSAKSSPWDLNQLSHTQQPVKAAG